MRKTVYFPLLLLLFLSGGCVKQFVPDINEKEELLVVEGLITDQPGIFTITLSRSQPLWKKSKAIPIDKSTVWITDDLGKSDTLKESKPGTYVTDSSKFRAFTGREYTLHINTAAKFGGLRYQSKPVIMIPVPPVDSIYYEKRDFINNDEHNEGCQIFLDTWDPSNTCKLFRWNFEETWEFHIPYEAVVNKICWISARSENIMIKSTTGLAEARVTKYPVNLITNPIDRLTVKYSILINQFSLNEDEYLYWESLSNVQDEVGGLYDIIPANIPNNLFCLDNPDEKVLGYFSVSAVKSRRIFIRDNFVGINHLYDSCPTDTAPAFGNIPYLNVLVWVLYTTTSSDPPYAPFRVLTDKKECADCTTRGTITRPSFWK